MSAGYCDDDHLAHLLAAALELDRRGSRTPFRWDTPVGQERELTLMTFREMERPVRVLPGAAVTAEVRGGPRRSSGEGAGSWDGHSAGEGAAPR